MNNRSVLPAIAVVVLLVVGGCSSSDEDADSGDTSSPDATETTASDSAETSAPEDDASGGSGGEGTGTLTLSDGTELSFAMTTCETSDTNPDSYLISNAYDMNGESDDGYRLGLIRAGVDDDTTGLGDLEADFDENGVNPGISYNGLGAEEIMLTVDGPSLTGTVIMSSPAGEQPFGESFEATVDITC